MLEENMDKKITIAIMDAPYESPNTVTAFRLIEALLKKGVGVNVFAYEGAVSLTMKGQQQHANPVKGTTLEEEQHPTPKSMVERLMKMGSLNWVNCGLCVDERGAGDWIDGVKRGGPGDFVKMIQESDNLLLIPTYAR
jgi:tRNA 2-thiouridine synthesizing protein D